MDDKATLHRRFASRLYILSQGGGRSFINSLLDFGKVW